MSTAAVPFEEDPAASDAAVRAAPNRKVGMTKLETTAEDEESFDLWGDDVPANGEDESDGAAEWAREELRRINERLLLE